MRRDMKIKNKLKHLDLFSGLGGFSLGLEATGGFETVAFCDIEKFPRKVLKQWRSVILRNVQERSCKSIGHMLNNIKI